MPRAVGVLVFAGLAHLVACSSGQSEGAAGRTKGERRDLVPVHVATAVRKDVPVELHTIGTVQPFSTVSVKSQVEGQLAEVYFAEGQEVRRGDILFLIDPRPFDAVLQQADANLARDRAQAENARLEAARLTALLKQGVVSQTENDAARARAESNAAAVKADEAALEHAKLELAYCSIHAPIDGRIGAILVHPGNVVKANETMLAVLNQMKPIYVEFSLPQQNLPAVRRYRAERTLEVMAAPPADPAEPATGELSFINNTVDTTTGTVLLKGLFPNTDERLWPGQFVNVALRLTTQRDVVVIPNRAVQAGQSGSYVFVVKPDDTVELRPLGLGTSAGPEVVVEQGIAPGERVVTDGQIRLAPGVAVAVQEESTS